MECLTGICKPEHVNGDAAPAEKNSDWLRHKLSSNWMLHNDDRFENNFTNFVMFLQRFPAEGEENIDAYRNSSVLDVVRFLDENAEMSKAAYQDLEKLVAIYRSEVAVLNGKHQQQVIEIESLEGKIRDHLCHLKKVSTELSDAQAQLSSTKGSLVESQSEVKDRNEAVRVLQSQLDEQKMTNRSLSENLDTIQKYMKFKNEDLEKKLSHSQEAGQAKDREVHELRSILEKNKIAMEEMESVKLRMAFESDRGQYVFL